MPKQTLPAMWNPEADLWEVGAQDAISGLSDVYWETWPTSGMTRNGVAYALPTWEPPTSGSACSSSPPAKTFRTPAAAEAEGGPRNRNRPGATMRLSDQVREEMEDGNLRVFPTPEAKLANSGPDYARASRPGSGGHDLTTAVHLLPTPGAADGSGGRVSAEMGGTRASGAKRSITLSTAVHHQITTRTGDPTPPPSTAGNPSWEDVPLPLPGLESVEDSACPPDSWSG